MSTYSKNIQLMKEKLGRYLEPVKEKVSQTISQLSSGTASLRETSTTGSTDSIQLDPSGTRLSSQLFMQKNEDITELVFEGDSKTVPFELDEENDRVLVRITDETMNKLVDAHNARTSRCCGAAQKSNPLGHTEGVPPMLEDMVNESEKI